jgi:hypothetical protein
MFIYHHNHAKYFHLSIGDVFSVGRTGGTLVLPDDTSLSGQHFRLSYENHEGKCQVFLEDMGSKNRTALERRQIESNLKIPVKPESVIEAGEQIFLLLERNDYSSSEIRKICEARLRLPLVKLEAVKLVKNLQANIAKELTGFIQSETVLKKQMEQKLSQIEMTQKEITSLRTLLEDELANLEKKRNDLMADFKARSVLLEEQMKKTQLEISAAEAEIRKIEAEIEARRKRMKRYVTLKSE